jgi:competence protein ComGC
MQYRLSTIFLVFFVVAASLAAFDSMGVIIATSLLILALLVNNRRTQLNLMELLVLLSILGILIALCLPVYSQARERTRMKQCIENLKKIGLALNRYNATHGHLPMQTTQNSSGKA